MLTDSSPGFRKESFDCPLCGVRAAQSWDDVWIGAVYDADDDGDHDFRKKSATVAVSECHACEAHSLWHKDPQGERMLWPPAKEGPTPAVDMPDEVRGLYEEARAVSALSPRAAAALLRTSAEVLLRQVTGDERKRLDEAIGELVQAGRLDTDTQRAADLLRLTGNDAVHPSEIQLSGDERATGLSMFHMVNMLVERLITVPRQLEALFLNLPPSKRDHIEKRDGTVPSSPQGSH